MKTPHVQKKAKHLNSSCKGFALVIALGLMAFVLLLLLTITTKIQVETSIGDTTKFKLSARQNAKLALLVAIGELQKYAGPDQRISASVGLLDTTPSTLNIDGYTNVQNWTGIWDATYPTDNGKDPISIRASGNTDLNAYLDISNRSSNRLLKLLVSGNQELDAASSYTPDSRNDALLLSNDTDTTKNVYAPKVTIGESKAGKYSYWVADEGAKAKFNIRDTHLKDGNNNERRYSFQTAQRSGIEHIKALNNKSFPTNDTRLEKLWSNNQLSALLDDATIAKNSFHDLTAYSIRLLTDTKHGGLKKDLTWFLEQPAKDLIPTSLQDFSFYNTTPFFNIVEPRIADFPQANNAFCEPGPTWKKLRSFYQLKDNYANGMLPRPHDDITYGIGPIAIRSILGVTPEIIEKAAETDLYFRAHLDFQVILWNPYNVPLAPHAYEIEFMHAGAGTVLYPEFVFDQNVTGNSSDAPLRHSGGRNFAYYPNSRVAQHGDKNTKGALSEAIDGVLQHPNMSTFRDEAGAELTGVIFTTPTIALAPGQVILLSIDNNNDEPYVEGYELTEGANGGSVYLDYPTPLPTIVSEGVTQIDATTGTVQRHYPKFKWRQWRSWGNQDLALGNEFNNSSIDIGSHTPAGEVRSFGLREPLAAGDSRDLKDNANDLILKNRFPYYSRLYRENYSNATTNSTWDLIQRTSGEIARDGGGNTRILNSDWNSGPNFNAKFEYGASMYSFDNGPTSNGYGTPPPFILRNPIAIDSRRDGIEESAFSGGYAYTCIGWTSAPKHNNYGSSTSIDSDGSGNAYFGNSYSASGSTHVPLADVPNKEEPILSLGFFQHANLYRFDTAPAFQIGNSFAETRLKAATELVRNSPYGDSDHEYNMRPETQSIIDSTYLLNDALWDRFFLSTYNDPANINVASFTAPNARIARASPKESISNQAINNFFDIAAAHLTVNGAFNVNSISVDAWKATLGSLSDLNIDPKTGNLDTTLDRVVSHFSSPENLSNDLAKNDLWAGFRSLTEQQLTALAEAMVEQVKIRGPFLSMAEFVNRRLDNSKTGYRGALQAAIDSLDYKRDHNNQLSTAATSINYNAAMTFGGESNITSDGNTPGGLPPTFPIAEAARAHYYTGMPGWVTQGDILQHLAPILTVRSDTFRIRAYGESIDPLTNTAQSRAWCEAIVQRIAEPVSPLTTNSDSPSDYQPNDAFGRKFKIISLNWLSSEEI
ncbi:hypothetical protein QEH59_17155 [Coraliomargarita sp. SDUM461004]|uniref:Uncharacterized protein n=1 Tax=Thalassobacterium sedimentorum TaxID=3041258 RepID=A0ABU1AMZ0_9BACT|nr:hypothetical protein [Coraliomargarita sp. SDUM461004]MDQ8196167.1 hypothetical protein [Coraliomargarita sp. SDUM461004]